MERLQKMEEIVKKYIHKYVELRIPVDMVSCNDQYYEGFHNGQREVMKDLMEEIDNL